MNTKEKKTILLLKAALFYYSGWGDKEEKLLLRKAREINGTTELNWVMSFIEKDIPSAQTRAQKKMCQIAKEISNEHRLTYLWENWEEGMRKGYLSNPEALYLLKIAKAWKVEKELLKKIDT